MRAERQTVVTPENVGGSSDVLYSSAGNVREELYFNYGVFAFGWEVGGSVYNPATGNFQAGSFQPPWVGDPDGRQRPQRDDGVRQRRDGDVPDRRRLGRRQDGGDLDARRPAAQSDSPKGVRFDVSEPATVYYTTDGTEPTLQSPRYKQTEFREPGETLWVEQTTTFRWFSVDAAGNLEPLQSATVQIGENGAAGGTVPATLSLSLGAERELRRLHAGRGAGLHGDDDGERDLDRR